MTLYYFTKLLLFALSLICLAIPLVWSHRKHYFSITNPLLYLAVFIFLGVNLKLFYILFIRPDDIVALLYMPDDRILQDHDITLFLPGIVAILLGLIAMVAGHEVSRKSMSIPAFITNVNFDRRRLFSVIYIIFALSMVSFFLFVSYEYFSKPESGFIEKRFNDIEGGSTNRIFHFKYYLYRASTFSRYAFYVFLIYLLLSPQEKSGKNISLVFLLYTFTLLVSCYVGNRAHVLITVLDLMLIFSLHRSRKNMYMVSGFVTIAASIILITTIVRQEALVPTNEAIEAAKQREKPYRHHITRRFEQIQDQTTETRSFAKSYNGTEEASLFRLTQTQIERHSLYEGCKERVSQSREYLTDYNNKHIWGEEYQRFVFNRPGQRSIITDTLSDFLNLNQKRDICSGYIDAMANPNLSLPTPGYIQMIGKIERFMQGRYFVDIVKTSYLLEAFPRKIDYLHGQTLIGWIFAPVPRSIWPDKPIFMHISSVLSTLVFNEPSNNIPPGIFAEMYINFGWVGILVGMFFIGYIIQYIYNTFLQNKNILIVQAIYAIIIIRLSTILYNTSMGDAILKIALDLAPIFLILWFTLKPTPSLRE